MKAFCFAKSILGGGLFEEGLFEIGGLFEEGLFEGGGFFDDLR